MKKHSRWSLFDSIRIMSLKAGDKVKFIITTDSACDYPIEELHKLGVQVIPFKYSDGTTIYTDTMTSSSYQKFYQDMRNGVSFKTSQLNPMEYHDFFQPYIIKKLPILHISLASGLSNTINNAFAAKSLLEEEYDSVELKIIDSKLASLGLTMLIDEAIKCRDGGMDIQETYERVKGLVKHINTYYTTDTLVYFARGGRLSKVEAFIGNALRVNPILDCLPNGELNVCAKAHGSKKALLEIANRVRKTVEDPESQTLYITHADCLERAIELRDLLMNEFHFKDSKIYPMGPTIGAHAGPGLLSAFYFGKARLVTTEELEKEEDKKLPNGLKETI